MYLKFTIIKMIQKYLSKTEIKYVEKTMNFGLEKL